MTEDIKQIALIEHEKRRGKIEVNSKVPLKDFKDLSTYYSPGVAEPCRKIAEDESLVNKYCSRGNMVAVVSDGSAVLGLGNIGAKASLPVMEGKAVLLKQFGNVDAFPICLDTQDVDEIVSIVKAMSPSFGGINLEDISAPRCFEIEERLIKDLDIPVFHDDQHGTAIVALAGLINSLKLVKKEAAKVKVVISGAGAAGIAICKLLKEFGFKNLILCDSRGMIFEGRDNLNWAKEEVAKFTNLEKREGSLKDALVGADIFLGVSSSNLFGSEEVKSMANDPIIFAMANPVPEVDPEEAKKGGAAVIATGRSDHPNQVNNVLVFPGLFRGVLDSGKNQITTKMKLAAAEALAGMVKEVSREKIIPGAFDEGVAEVVAEAVKSVD